MCKKILVIEDEASFRSILKEVLNQAGYEVSISPYVASAISDALSGRFDLITLDLRIPGIDGVEIARLFYRNQVVTPVLVISGYLDDNVRKKLEEAGVHHFLKKPSEIKQLIRAVEQAIC
jgi:DNA-binding response OmpR family regulator